ncbi:SIMPL domain-containing protein [Pseudomonas sp. 5P_3.1_Bac2]|uniref:SIMPL domain-containing protein n=1 Tax=Pseudomonas sp. 5P_3.1_Bac2 TaxID=2971617 RepID=UPI0021C64B62|nr:SIMPL domain-containing protein [Pseudomonas sp. 5P_3.1_Bac2]MCU1715620.1 SIMPL domain-containing protein [Pseudomonas sp. 5P_3.1_Bac2]
MLKLSRLASAALLSSCATLSLNAVADAVRYNQVALNAEVSQEIAHDMMDVTLYSEEQNSDPAALAEQISKTLNSAISKARQVKDIQVSSGSRNSYPIYDQKNQKITGWRERAELRLQSADFAALSKLTGELLGELKMAGMNFSIASATRKKHEDQLIKDAVAAFKARAQLTTEALGGKDYKLVSLNLNSGGFQPPVYRMNAAFKGIAMAASADAMPEVEAGTSQVSLTADGVIEVQLP